MDLTGGLTDRIYGKRKAALLGPLQGDVLEIGPGPGVNLKYFSPSVRWIGVEPNIHARAKISERAAHLGMRAEALTGTAEKLALDDSSVDVAVATLVLCSVDDVAVTLAEILRVLRPGGSCVFIEHVAAERGTQLRRFQDAINPIWRVCADGCNANRETARFIAEAGFDGMNIEQFRVSSPMIHLAPHIAGTAKKSDLARGGAADERQ